MLQQDVERRLVEPLDDDEVALLAGLLRRLLVAVDPDTPPRS